MRSIKLSFELIDNEDVFPQKACIPDKQKSSIEDKTSDAIFSVKRSNRDG